MMLYWGRQVEECLNRHMKECSAQADTGEKMFHQVRLVKERFAETDSVKGCLA